MEILRTFWNSPVGPKTTHFWGPFCNWSIPIAGIADMKKPPELISTKMTSVLCLYSAVSMRFAWMVRPRNHFLLVCHITNETVQLYQLSRCLRASGSSEQKQKEETEVKQSE